MNARLPMVLLSVSASLAASWWLYRELRPKRQSHRHQLKKPGLYGIHRSKQPRLHQGLMALNLLVTIALWLGTALALMRLAGD